MPIGKAYPVKGKGKKTFDVKNKENISISATRVPNFGIKGRKH